MTLAGSGSNNSVVGGTNSTAVTSDGSAGVIMGGSGGLSVYDNGTSDTIAAFGASSANVSLAGSGGSAGTGALLFGGTNNLDAVVSNVFETVIGGSGAVTVSIANLGIATDNLVFGGSGSLTVER